MSIEPLDGPDPSSPQGGGVLGLMLGFAVGCLIGFWWWSMLGFGWWSALPPFAVALLGWAYGDRFRYWLVHIVRWW